MPDFRMFHEYSMTLRELLQSVDAEAYVACPIDVAPDLQVTNLMMELFDEENAYTALAEQWENYGTLNGSPPKRLPSERKLQFSDEAISIWKYLYRK